MKIAYVTGDDPHDLKSWSGLSHHIARSLAQPGAEIHYLGPLATTDTLAMRLRRRLYRLAGKQLLESREPSIVRGWARQVTEKLRGLQPDLILATHTELLSEFDSPLPIAYWSDSNFGCMLDAYPYFQGLTARTIRLGHEYERRALARANLVLYAGDWAADAAAKIHGCDPAKVKVIPFGANLECDRTAGDIGKLIAARPTDQCRLIFLGKAWARKGGDTAVAVAEELNRAGLPTTLTLVGSQPPPGTRLPDFVRPAGFIDKSDPEGRRRFNALLGESHFLILPSRAEAFGIVFCEAASFGVPSLATRVGGIPTAVREGHNGRLFPPAAPPADYADFVRQMFRHYADYEQLARAAFQEYETRLNWRVAGATAMNHLQTLLARKT